MLNDIQKQILAVVSGMAEDARGAVNIRADGKSAYRSNSPFVRIESKTDKEGIDIFVEPNAVADHVYIPVVITAEGFHDVVYNDFYIGEGAKVTINAGCGIHNCGSCDSEHDGIHTFHVGKNATVTYSEVHYGDGEGEGKRILNPQTILYLEEGAKVTLESTQIRGVDDTKRYTKAVLSGPNAEFIVQEKLLTHNDQRADSVMEVFLDGEGASTRVISRSVAQDRSTQTFYPKVVGNCACFGHVQCDSIIMGKAKVRSIPEISCNHVDASLIHEAAIGKIAGDQILKLQTLGLSYEEAEEKILEGFLR